jgi:hypothetical protein
METTAARRGGPVLVCDSDPFVLSRRVASARGSGVREVSAVAALAHPDALYLLAPDDEVLASALRRGGRRQVVLDGTPQDRLAGALDAIDGLLAEGWDLAAPRLPGA